MYLLDAIKNIETLSPNATIWIDGSEDWTPHSLVLVAEEREGGGPPEGIPLSYKYFLEVAIVAGLAEDLGVTCIHEVAGRVIHYAVNDA